MQAADWNEPNKHQSWVITTEKGRALIARQLDGDWYYVRLQWTHEGRLNPASLHELVLTAGLATRIEFVVAFSQQRPVGTLPTAAETIAASTRSWQQFWTRGAAVELAQSKDKRAIELERRVVLSQYLTAIQCAGSMPPQETGLTVNSWYGKFHLEMHWWHAAHFAFWNRLPLLEKSLGWYQSILPRARGVAR